MGRIREGPVHTVSTQGPRRPGLVGRPFSLRRRTLTLGTECSDAARQAPHPASVCPWLPTVTPTAPRRPGHFPHEGGDSVRSRTLCFPLAQRTNLGQLTEMKQHPVIRVSQRWPRAFVGQSRNRAEAEVLWASDRKRGELRGSGNSAFLSYEQGQKKKKSLLVIIWSQNSFSKNFTGTILKQKIRVTWSKSMLLKEMAIIKMCKEKKKKKLNKALPLYSPFHKSRFYSPWPYRVSRILWHFTKLAKL